MKRIFTSTLSLLALTAMTGCGPAHSMHSDAMPMHADAAPMAPEDGVIRNEAQFRAAMIGPGTLSLMESQLADDKASNRKVREFAMFETDEQNALGTILKELNTPAPAPTAADEATINKLQAAHKGKQFDKAYIKAQIEGHQKLKAITDSYLQNADTSSANPKEIEARHLAIFARAAIKQHIANTKEILGMMR